MKLITLVVGPLAENAYVVAPDGPPDGSRECVVIDPGAEGERIVDEVKRAGLEVRYIVVTHGHGDHTGAVATVKRELGGVFAAHEGDLRQIEQPLPWVTEMLPDFVQPPPVDRLLDDGETLEVGETALRVIATPGHTPGSICFGIADAVFTGDTLFRGTIGRHDLPGSDGRLEVESIRSRLLTLPDETRVLPGHGPPTTIGEERASNPFLQADGGATPDQS